jgi:dCMP deaminase
MNTKNLVNYIPAQSKLGWNEYFMLQAIMASFKSKDPNTQVGCVFVDDKNHQLSMGYNGFVAGIDESKLPWGNDRNADFEHQKYGYVVHSEANAILHAKGDLTGSKLYVTLFPCEECSKMLASKKVKEIFYLSDKYAGTPGNIVAKKILDLTGIKYTKLQLDTKQIDLFKDHAEKLIQDA